MIYTVARTGTPPRLDAPFDGPDWAGVPTLTLNHFFDEGSGHRPVSHARVCHDGSALHVAFHVHDRWVRCVQAGYQAPVCRDSCVEFFVEPVPGRGYFNFEVSCGGHLLLHYNEVDGDDIRRTALPDEAGARVVLAHSLPGRVEPEIESPVEWQAALAIPLDLFDPWVGPVGVGPGAVWRANFYKCGDETSHPHWGMWAPITGRLSFHQPQFFGRLHFT